MSKWRSNFDSSSNLKGGGGCNPGKHFFPFWPILTGLTGSGLVVLVGYNSSYKTFVGLNRH